MQDKRVTIRKGAAKNRVMNFLVKERPFGNWEDLHRERMDADADRA